MKLKNTQRSFHPTTTKITPPATPSTPQEGHPAKPNIERVDATTRGANGFG